LSRFRVVTVEPVVLSHVGRPHQARVGQTPAPEGRMRRELHKPLLGGIAEQPDQLAQKEAQHCNWSALTPLSETRLEGADHFLAVQHPDVDGIEPDQCFERSRHVNSPNLRHRGWRLGREGTTWHDERHADRRLPHMPALTSVKGRNVYAGAVTTLPRQ